MKPYLTLLTAACLLSACHFEGRERVVDTWDEQGTPKEVRSTDVETGGEDVQQYHKNGRIHTRGKLVEGLRQGTWNTYREDGLPWSQVTYADGIKQGLFRTWHPGGTPHIEGQHEKDQPSGVWRFYATDGSLVETLDYDAAN